MLSDAASLSSLVARIELLKRAHRTIDSVVDGSSMEPTIARGTGIRINAQPEVPPDGTVVAILTPGGTVTHRLLRRGRLPWNRQFVLTQGDGATLCDPPIDISLLIGPVTIRRADGAWREVPERSKLARAMHWRARIWRLAVQTAFSIHPVSADFLVRCSLHGRVERVQWQS